MWDIQDANGVVLTNMDPQVGRGFCSLFLCHRVGAHAAAGGSGGGMQSWRQAVGAPTACLRYPAAPRATCTRPTSASSTAATRGAPQELVHCSVAHGRPAAHAPLSADAHAAQPFTPFAPSCPPRSNKAPVGVYIHAAWLMDPARSGAPRRLGRRCWARRRRRGARARHAPRACRAPTCAALNTALCCPLWLQRA